MAGSSSVRLFERIALAEAYSKFRVTYPKEIYDKIKSFTDRHRIQLELVVDIGCGSGQSTFQLSPLCQQVVGIDISPAQIECAQQSPDNKTISNVEFKVASADQLPFPDRSVSMVTCAQAWHWFDPVTTYPEVCRILKFPGCLAIFGYGQFLLKNTKCEKVFKEFCHQSVYLYRHPGSTPVDNLYRTINLPLPQMERYEWIIDCDIELPIFIGYLSTTSSWQQYCLAHPNTKLLQDLQKKLSVIIKNKIISLSYTVFLLLCLQ